MMGEYAGSYQIKPMTLEELTESLMRLSEDIASLRNTAVEIGEDDRRGWKSGDYRRISADIAYWEKRREQLVDLAKLLRGQVVWQARREA